MLRDPELRGALEGSSIDIKASSKAHVEGRVTLFHPIHQELLSGAAHGYENHIRLCLFNIQKNPVKALIIKKTVMVSKSEEHTSELQSRGHLVCRLLLEQ